MDQKFVSGIGNIYANEILFMSKINPSRKVKKLKEFELKKIVNYTKKILKKAIELGGSSIKDFSSSNGKNGSFQQHFNVYGKKGESVLELTVNIELLNHLFQIEQLFFALIAKNNKVDPFNLPIYTI